LLTASSLKHVLGADATRRHGVRVARPAVVYIWSAGARLAGSERALGVTSSRSPPGAKDATWRRLPTHYVLTGNAATGYALTQHVSTVGARFPVTADPHYTWGWVTGTVYFNKHETRILAEAAGAVAFIATLTGPWAALIEPIAISLEAAAWWAVFTGRCVAVKSTAYVYIYSGKTGDGYCK
jgi:hypothetical protein